MNIIYLLIGTIILLMAITIYLTTTHIRRQRNKKYALLKVKKIGGAPLSKKELAYIGGYTYVPIKKFVDIKWRDWKNPKEVWDIIVYTINPFVKYRLKIEKLEDRIRSLNSSIDNTRRFVCQVEERVTKFEKKEKKVKKPSVSDSERLIKHTLKKTEEALQTVQGKFDDREADINDDGVVRRPKSKVDVALQEMVEHTMEQRPDLFVDNAKKLVDGLPSSLDGMDKVEEEWQKEHGAREAMRYIRTLFNVASITPRKNLSKIFTCAGNSKRS